MTSGQSLIAGQGILPEGSHLALFEAADGEPRKISQLPFSSLDKFTTNTEGWVASIPGTDAPSVVCWNANTMADFALPLPITHHPDAMAFAGQILYVGGHTEERLPFLGLYDLGAQSPQWNAVQVPDQVSGWDKSVDALLVDGPRLIAIDNIVTPVWLLVYDISEPLQPEISTVERLEPHGTYERIMGATADSNWIAVLTMTVSGWIGRRQHIAFLDKNSLEERAVISIQRLPKYEPGPCDWHGVVLWDDFLLVAAGMDGIGILDLSGIGGLEVDSEVLEKELFFVSPPNFQGEEVIHIILGRFADCLGLVLKRNGSIRSMLLHQQDLLDIQSHKDRVPFAEIDRKNSEPSAA